MILEIIFGVYGLITVFVIVNLLRKVERLEDWGEQLATRVSWVQDRFKEIDSKGHFEADDEVGVIFEQIKTTINQLDRFKGEEQ